MSTNEPMTQEQLDVIRERAGKAPTLQLAVSGDTNRIALYHSDDVDALIAEVERLRALTTVDKGMLARAQREYEWSGNIRRVLNAALGTGEGA